MTCAPFASRWSDASFEWVHSSAPLVHSLALRQLLRWPALTPLSPSPPSPSHGWLHAALPIVKRIPTRNAVCPDTAPTPACATAPLAEAVAVPPLRTRPPPVLPQRWPRRRVHIRSQIFPGAYPARPTAARSDPSAPASETAAPAASIARSRLRFVPQLPFRSM